MTRYIPFPFFHDDMPIDISSAFGQEMPAGKHGFMQVRGDRFVFEDGTPARFWGVNFNGGACFPSHEYARQVAVRLRKTGVNLVRFHQLDAEWNTPNIFQFCKGPRLKSTRILDEQSLERLDYLVFCLKQEGIYCYLDMLTYRKFRSGDGVDNPLAVRGQNNCCCFDPTLIALQKEYMSQIWQHANPYTGLAYKDDPVFVLTEIVNERDLFFFPMQDENYLAELREMFRRWLAEHEIGLDADRVDLNSTSCPPLTQFKEELLAQYYRECRETLRTLGVRIPIAGTNFFVNGAVTRANHQMNDFCDSHAYFYDWRWEETQKSCMNRALTQSREFDFEALTCTRDLEKPFFVSEWDVPWPNEYRAESAIVFAAASALQGYSGLAIHTYAYSSRLSEMRVLGKEVSSSAIGGVPFREGVFSTWNDPAKYGLFYHAALILRRQDVRPAQETLKLRLRDLGEIHAGRRRLSACGEWKRTGVVFEDAEDMVEMADTPCLPETGKVCAVTGELMRSWKEQYGWVDTPRTQCAYGFLARQGTVALSAMSVCAQTDFAVIALSSLTDAPVAASDSLLLTAVGRARNTGAQFDGEKMQALGIPPVEIEVIEAEVVLQTACATLRVIGINAEGMHTGEIPSQYENGQLRFTIGRQFCSMYYLLQAE